MVKYMKVYSIKGIAFKKELDQDALIIRNDLARPVVVICDGHGNKLGREFASKIAKIGIEAIPKDVEITREYADIISQNFVELIGDRYESLYEEYKGCGTTFLMVIFESDYRRYIVVKLGDSYVMNIPEDFSGNGSEYAFDMEKVDKKWYNSMHPIRLWRQFLGLSDEEKERLNEGGIGWVNYCMERFGANFGVLGLAFRRDNVAISTMGVEPDLVNPDEDVRKCLSKFIVSDCLEVPDGHMVVISSDGLPIHREEMWEHLRRGTLSEYMSEKRGETDDCTAVVIYPD